MQRPSPSRGHLCGASGEPKARPGALLFATTLPSDRPGNPARFSPRLAKYPSAQKGNVGQSQLHKRPTIGSQPAQHSIESELAGRAVADRTGVGFLLIDSLRRPTYANAEAARILVYPARPGDDSSLEPLLGNKIRAVLPQSKGVHQTDFHTVFLSGRRHYLCRAFHFGARSMVSAQVNTALLLERIVQGRLDTSEIARQFGLTPREQETTELLMLGLSSKEIASRMSISPNTVKAFLRLVMFKMGVTSRSGVVGKILAHAIPKLQDGGADAPNQR
jgi:DNA-binding CsgD family transcriptional regulator